MEIYFNDEYRSKCPRFYFLSNDQLIELIGAGLDPRLYQSSVRKLFSGIDQIEYHLPEQIIGGSMNNSQTINSATIDVYGNILSLSLFFSIISLFF